MVGKLTACGMGLLLDIAPNHMAASVHNPWWADVLENGPASPYAAYFDIDWQARVTGRHLANRVLLPILDTDPTTSLCNQELTLAFESGSFFVHYRHFHGLTYGDSEASGRIGILFKDLLSGFCFSTRAW